MRDESTLITAEFVSCDVCGSASHHDEECPHTPV